MSAPAYTGATLGPADLAVLDAARSNLADVETGLETLVRVLREPLCTLPPASLAGLLAGLASLQEVAREQLDAFVEQYGGDHHAG
ncbi:hypothetical protein IGB42_02642 [Andreprevotia sp. IGB-42]|uniref:hypothetical protein n=1 Tax=Andreprevotia sp. IGB-42 TaxID=2497473 RepID=UPI001357489E|nr:hypothetical protein [Andreprevotia sp. IGB-42]KAF0812799.1 hypothetical protein IGB42_02642 [Andreprevotia sp. IGB-42]